MCTPESTFLTWNIYLHCIVSEPCVACFICYESVQVAQVMKCVDYCELKNKNVLQCTTGTNPTCSKTLGNATTVKFTFAFKLFE